MSDLELICLAEQARQNAYAPYSEFRVGAALLGASGRVYLGCNIENAAYTPTNCAERTAFFKAVSEGERQFSAIAIVGGQGESTAELCAPCGVCRQVMAEFCNPDFRILLGNSSHIRACTLDELFPLSFSPRDLQPKGDKTDEDV